MKNNPSATLAASLKKFLGEYLPHQRAYSPHTIQSYRDSLKLLLQFAAGPRRRVCELSLADLRAPTIIAFLDYLQTQRGNQTTTRNVRLGAIHSFFDYLGAEHPEHLDQAQRILCVGFKRADHRTVEYLEPDELRAILGVIDCSTAAGVRDLVLLTLMFNTGARVQEVVSLKTDDLRLTSPPSVRLFGKGRKERICPLWPETARLLKQHLNHNGLDPKTAGPLFQNHRGQPLTRFGARLILRRHVLKAAKIMPALKSKRIHPHSLRHSTAVHLLRSGVDLSTIAHWLGHCSINTTHKYVTVDLAAKQTALAKAAPITIQAAGGARWKTSEDLLAWLESL